MEMSRTDRNRKRGFTLGELLIVVAILAVLGGLTTGAVITIQRTIRQKKLDDLAGQIYQVAERQLAAMKNAGDLETVAEQTGGALSGGHAMAYVPRDAGDDVKTMLQNGVDNIADASAQKIRLLYVTPADTATANILLPADTLLSDVRSANWIVEYDAESGNVYGVFYSETEALAEPGSAAEAAAAGSLDGLRESAAARRAAGARIGYYGGSALWTAAPKTVNVDLSLINQEQLQAAVSYKLPNVTANGVTAADTLKSLSLTVTDESKASWTVTATAAGVNSFTYQYAATDSTGTAITAPALTGGAPKLIRSVDSLTSRTTLRYTLDSMLTGQGFAALTGLHCGDDITVTVRLTTASGLIGSASAKGNSAFANKSSATQSGVTTATVGIAYCRHLQNLNSFRLTASTSKVSAVQLQDLSFAEDTANAADWYTLYTAKTFVPIDEAHATYITALNGNGHTITGLSISDTANANVGLFREFRGVSLSHLHLVDAVVKSTAADAAVGALAGTSGSLTSISDCSVYLSDAGAQQAAKKGTQTGYLNMISGAGGSVVGGLVGRLTGNSPVAITESSVSTSLSGATAAGLIGSCSAPLTIQSCYTDSYISANYAAGLVTAAARTVTITTSFTTGFITGKAGSADFVLAGTGVAPKSTSSYSSAVVSADTAAAVYPISNSGTCKYVYYLSAADTGTAANGAIPTVHKNLVQANFIASSLHAAGSFIVPTAADSTYYNLNANGLVSGYPYPILKRAAAQTNTEGAALYAAGDPIHQYGDWQAQFLSGLVYYEIYQDNAGKLSYGFYGANVSLLKENAAADPLDGKTSGLTIVGDGYAMAYESGEIPADKMLNIAVLRGNTEIINKTNLKIGDYANAVNPATANLTQFDVSSADGSVTYTLVRLDSVTEALENAYIPAAGDPFYLTFRVNDTASNGNRFYYFNPFFAKTAVSTVSTAAPGSVLIRTARHLNNLSKYSVYWNLSFAQETDVDYSTYEGHSFSASVQSPIGSSAAKFTGSYDGGENLISGVSFSVDAAKGEIGYVGMFGASAGTLKNIVLNGNYTLPTASGASAAHRYFGITGNNIAGSGTIVYMGALAGYNEGAVSNCAVTGYLPMSNTAGTASTLLPVYNNATLYLGGFVGYNNGFVQTCSADTPSMTVSATAPKAVYTGGFVGYNNGAVRQSYDFTVIDGTLPSSSTGIASFGGFSGMNSSTLANCYSGASITVSGTRTEKYAFTRPGGNVSGCYYISDTSGSYYGGIHAYSFVDDGLSGTTALTMDQLKTRQISGFSAAEDTQPPRSDAAAFPYPAIIRRMGGTVTSVGEWPQPVDMGTVGIVYWEHEVGGSNEGWYFSYVDQAGNTNSTLCNKHDDGGVVEAYGYGYFCTTGKEDTWSRTCNYLNLPNLNAAFNGAEGSDAVRYQAAADALHTQLKQYTFVTFLSGQQDGQLRLTGATTTNTRTAWTVTGNTSDTFKAGTAAADSWYLCSASEYNLLANDSAYANVGADQKPYAIVSAAAAASYPNPENLSPAKIYPQVSSVDSYNYSNSAGTIRYLDATTVVAIRRRGTHSIQWFVDAYKYNPSYFDSYAKTLDISSAVEKTYDSKTYLVTAVSAGTNAAGEALYFSLQQSDYNSNRNDSIIDSNDKTWVFGICLSDGSSFTAYDNSATRGIQNSSAILKNNYYCYLSVDYRYIVLTQSTKETTTYTDGYYVRRGQFGKNVPGTSYITESTTDFAPNASITLTNTTDKNSYSFVLNPFFGDSMRKVPVEDSSLGAASDARLSAISTVIGDGTPAESSDALGASTQNPYSVRSVAQLQFINWNRAAGNKNCSTSVSAAEKYNFTYLTALHSTSEYTSSAEKQAQAANGLLISNPNFYWKQSHDIKASSATNYTPIADSTSHDSSYFFNLDAVFTGAYNGQDYVIENLNISSANYAVGLFGITVNARLSHIILYSSDGQNYVERTGNKTGAYALGGLVGIAYSVSGYENTSGISDCSIAGYQVIDKSTGKPTLGEANVGGLIGVANVNLTKCSSVADVQLKVNYSGHAAYGNYIRVGGLVGSSKFNVTNCYTGGRIWLEKDAEGNDGPWNWQTITGGRVDLVNSNSIYAGGVVGGSFSASFKNLNGSLDLSDTHYANCYTYTELPAFGGAVRGISAISSVGDRYAFGTTLYISNCFYLKSEVLKNNIDPDVLNQKDTDPAAYAAAVSALNALDLTYYNYDTYDLGYKVDVNKRVTLASIDNTINGQTRGYYSTEGTSSRISTGTYYQNMILGCMNYQRYRYSSNVISGANNPSLEHIDLIALDYSAMADASPNGMLAKLQAGNAAWHMVDTTESGGVAVNGKYSHSISASLKGRNYPFPTILTQTNNNALYHVHYGDWPADGIELRANGVATTSVTRDLLADAENHGDAVTVSIQANLIGNADTGATAADSVAVRIDDASGAVSLPKNTDGSIKWDSGDTLTLTCINAGSDTITFSSVVNGVTYENYLTVNVTADIFVKANAVTLAAGSSAKVQYTTDDAPAVTGDMIAIDSKGRILENVVGKAAGAWSTVSLDPDVEVTAATADTAAPILQAADTVDTQKDTAVAATFTYTLNGAALTGSKLIPVSIIPPVTARLYQDTVLQENGIILYRGAAAATELQLKLPDLLTGTADSFANYATAKDIPLNETQSIAKGTLLSAVASLPVYKDALGTTPADSALTVTLAFQPDGTAVLTLQATDGVSPLAQDETLYLRLLGVSADGSRSALILVPVTITNPGDGSQTSSQGASAPAAVLPQLASAAPVPANSAVSSESTGGSAAAASSAAVPSSAAASGAASSSSAAAFSASSESAAGKEGGQSQ